MCDNYKADPEKKEGLCAVDNFNADIESKRSAKRQRYEEDLEVNPAAKRRLYEEDLEENRAAKRLLYEEDLEENRAAKRRLYEEDLEENRAAKRLLTDRNTRTIQLSLNSQKGVDIGMTLLSDWLNVLPKGRSTAGVTELPLPPKGMLWHVVLSCACNIC